MLGDVAVRHPAARIRDVEQDVDGLASADEHRVLPDEVRLENIIARQDQKPAGPVHMKRVRHRMI